MARVIIITIPDNDDAEAFARWMLDKDKEGYDEDMPVVPPQAKIEAMIARPTVACQGSHRVPGKIRTERGFTRTKRFGWWVCASCKKPTKTIIVRFIENMLGGYNNLLPELDGGEPQEPRWIRDRGLIAVQDQLSGR